MKGTNMKLDATVIILALLIMGAVLTMLEYVIPPPQPRQVDCAALLQEVKTDMHAELFDRACPNYFLEKTP